MNGTHHLEEGGAVLLHATMMLLCIAWTPFSLFAQVGVGWKPVDSKEPTKPLRELTNPAKPGAVVIRGPSASRRWLRVSRALAKACPHSDPLDVHFDD